MSEMPLPSWLEIYREQFASAINAVFPAGPFDLYDLAAICDRESRGGLALKPPGPGGTGDMGHGHGLMQIDDRSFPEFCRGRDWADPAKNILMGAVVLNEKWRAVKTVAGAVAAYNCGQGNVLRALRAGLDVDYHTAHGNYSADVLTRAARFRGAPDAT